MYSNFKKWHPFIIIVLYLMGIAPIANGQSKYGGIEGIVTNTENETLVGVNVVIKGTTLGAATDENGHYFITKIPMGKYQVSASIMGYKPVTKTDSVLADQISVLNFTLSPTVIEVGTIVVTGTKTQRLLEDVPVHTEVISEKKIEAKNAENLQDALKGEVGIGVKTICPRCNAAEIQMQGLPGRYTQVLIDGMPVVSDLGSLYGLTQIPSENIERIEIVKGAGSAVYGSDAIAGVVNVITKSLGATGGDISANFGDFGSQALRSTLRTKMGKLEATATVSKSKADAVDIDGDGISDYVQSDRTASSIKLKQQLMSNMAVAIYGNSWIEERLGGSLDRIAGKTKEGDYVNPNINQWEFGGNLEWKPNNISSFTLKSVSSQYGQRVFAEESWYKALENIVFTEAQYTRYLTSKQSLSTGIDYKYDLVEENTRIGTRKINSTGIYAQDEMDYNPVNLVLGARYDNHSEFGSYLSPRGAIMYKLPYNLTLRGSFGFGFKAPAVFSEEMHFCSSTVMYEFISNPNIQPEKSRSTNFDLEYNSEIIAMGINLFRTDVKDMIQALVEKDTTTSVWKYHYNNIGKTLTQGVELNTTVRLGKGFSLRLGYSYLDAKDRETNEPLPFRSQHSANWGLDYANHAIGLGLNLSGEFVGTMPIWSETEQGADSPDYTIWNCKVSQKIGTNYTLFIGVDNIFDYAQRESIQDDIILWGPTRGRYLHGGVQVKF
jgi:outer membrane receptor for ferrienterochelin and colicins